MPTPLQLRLVHVAARKVGLNDAQYRTLLASAAGVASSRDLDQAGFEDVMAVLEDMGFRQMPNESYWREKVQQRGQSGNARMIHLIRRLAENSIYPLDRLAWRQSGGRTSDVEQLAPREAWMLIEMLKASNQRQETANARERHRQPSLF